MAPQKINGMYEIRGIDKLLSLEGIKLHIYGKKITKPHRKLGHITVLLKNKNPLEVSDKIKNIIEIKETI